MIVVFLAMLVVIQFAVLELPGSSPISSARMLLIGTGVALFWSVVPWLTQIVVATHIAGRTSAQRIRIGWGEYSLLLIFSMLLPGLIVVAGASAGNVYDSNSVIAFLLVAWILDLGGFTVLLAIQRGHVWWIPMVVLRFVVGSALVVQGTSIVPEVVSNADRAFALWPTIVAAFFAQWTVWAAIQYFRQLRSTDALRHLVSRAVVGTLPAKAISEHYRSWVRGVILHDEAESNITSESSMGATDQSDSSDPPIQHVDPE